MASSLTSVSLNSPVVRSSWMKYFEWFFGFWNVEKYILFSLGRNMVEYILYSFIDLMFLNATISLALLLIII